MIKPTRTLAMLAIVGLMGLLTMYVFPSDGIRLNDSVVLEFPTPKEFFSKDSTLRGKGVDLETLLQAYELPIDSTAIKNAIQDSIRQAEIAFRKQQLRLQVPANQLEHPLTNFFAALSKWDDQGVKGKMRILHYGDSQIEGDRITSWIRNQFQGKYGGGGPGYIPVYEVIPNFSIRQTQSDNWLRYTAYGRRDTTVNHKNFGCWGSFSRFTPYQADTLIDTTLVHRATVSLKPSRLGYRGVKTYRQIHLYYGNAQFPVQVSAFDGDALITTKTLAPSKQEQKVTFTFASTPQDLRFEFEGVYSPDFYGFSLEEGSGMVIDNIGMRGSSGTIFTSMDRGQLSRMLKREPITLVVLQYGGNTVPYIDSDKKAEKYGEWFASQIGVFKSILPNASFILIGPSDMSTKVKNNYVTFPYLTQVRDALKKAAFDHGAAYWDLYEVMGGENSMPSWVNADPPLAAKDYIHFTPSGARKVAELFYGAILEDYKVYQQHHQPTPSIDTLEEKEVTDPLKLPQL